MVRHRSGDDDTPPRFGDDTSFDRLLQRLRRGAWALIGSLLVAGAFAWQVPGLAVPSTVLRAAIVYVFVLFALRLAGKRTLAQLTTFDLVVLLILSESVQQALVGEDHSLTNAGLIVLTLVGLDALLGFIKDRSRIASRWLDDIPTVLVREGVLDEEAAARSRVDRDDIMEAARKEAGLTSFEEVRYAVLERAGGISVIPWARKD